MAAWRHIPARPQLGLFDNPVRVFSLDELAATVRKLERERPGRTVEELSGAVFTELAITRTRRAADLVAEAIRARAGNARAETRTRQEYYSDLRVTVSREESAVARQAMAEERAAAEKWQETAAESRWMWSEYQRKWPPTERPAVDRSKDPAGSWSVDRNRLLDVADNSRG